MSEQPNITSIGPTTYQVLVLWAAGASTGKIALALGRTPGSIRGIVNRRFPTPRDQMTVQERQAVLDSLLKRREEMRRRLLDNDTEMTRFNRCMTDGRFVARELAAPQKPKVILVPPSDPSKHKWRPAREERKAPPVPATKTEQRKRSKAAAKRRRREKKLQEMREKGFATKRGPEGAALEHLTKSQILSDPDERGVDFVARSKKMDGSARRMEAGEYLRKRLLGAEISGLKSVDFATLGGGASLGLALPAYRLECLDSIGAIREVMLPEQFELLAGIVHRDEFPWENFGREERTVLYEEIRCVLDIVALHAGFMTPTDFIDRWGYLIEPRKRMRRSKAKAKSAAVEELLRGAK